MAAHLLLTRNGYDVTLRIGIARDETVTAHSWVEYRGKPVFGDDVDIDRYTALPAFE